jgi:CheY-like chemotaxis protein
MSRLLIVEDQPDIRRLVRWSLELEPHELHEASNGAEGLQALGGGGALLHQRGVLLRGLVHLRHGLAHLLPRRALLALAR